MKLQSDLPLQFFRLPSNWVCTVLNWRASNEVAMCNWLRRHNDALGNAPFYLIVDEGRLEEVLESMQKSE
ncbi:MAG: hypothetical protein HKM22_01910 [Gammaproteobacteria bacterium]|nr:hypothetical protein [Gammaproteobacteria bacterium]